MAVQLHCAIDEEHNIRFINERLDSKMNYHCPHCKYEVIAKKGNQREHHFSHHKNASCSATGETILHFEAKHHLARLISSGATKDVQFPLDFKAIPAFNTLFKATGIGETSNTSLQKILGFYKIQGSEVESTIPGSGYIADIIGVSSDTDKAFIIEIVVEHEMEQKKIDFIKKHNLPYLELVPYYNNGQIQYELYSYFLPNFFDSYKEKVDRAMVDLLFPVYETRFKERAEKELQQEKLLKLKLQAVKALKEDIDNGNVYVYEELLHSMDSNNLSIQVKAFNANVHRMEMLEDISYTQSDEKYLIGKTNKSSYLIFSEQNLLREIIKKLLLQINISALIGGWSESTKDNIVGFDLEIPDRIELSKSIQISMVKMLEGYERRFEKKIKSL